MLNESLPVKRKVIIVLSVCMNLLNLVIFKYSDTILPYFFGESSSIQKIVLPLGISFYTLKNISYILDVYYERIVKKYSFSDYLFYTTFFPSVSAGPIYRIGDLNDKKVSADNTLAYRINRGFFLITMGLFFKVVLSDNLSPYVSRIFDTGLQVTALNAWLSSFAYSLQIYFDFNGYTYIAVGLAFLFGFNIPYNFDKPYAAKSITEFWKKWHITLSLWLRDYLFLPLAYGSHRRLSIKKRKQKELFVYSIAAFITFAICGVWHGAGWNFLLWGSMYGLLLIIERITGFDKKFNKGAFTLLMKRVIVFVIVTLLWVLFRAGVERSLEIYGFMFAFNNTNYDVLEFLPSLIISGMVALTLFVQFGYLDFIRNIFNKNKIYTKILYILFMAVLWASIIILKGESDTFIYFKF